ncbi:cytochrome d ubiquinol oxidase subunit II [Salipaludibacillus aurantiacus]|uniref:Cytochrome d ubiquinol oxidase subunit II n=1 Tax=Salipaludibacillus aurantiacus TaxID=1601833 RepID=A0A1H9S6T2_9BACI|nr:cytochrome d ubiquinol oxidase subunit II [Salipaludibacillus aurantiacus]SER80732.1 cytochrome d ubiquinol oxidase subunit II [Salipaludibacillus aurantiacus]
MTEPYIAILIIWVFLFVYAIAGSIDFGAGFWAMYYSDRETSATVLANRYLSPSWEVTNVFLVLLVIALVGFFPGAAFYMGTLMILPFSLVLILLTIRSAFMVFSFTVKKYTKALVYISGITGLLIPALMIAVLPVSIGGFIGGGERQYILFNETLASPAVYTHVGFGLATELFLSALLLSDYARESGSEKAYAIYRKNAVILGPVTLFFAVTALLTLIPEAPWMVEAMVDVWYLFALSLIAAVIGYSSLWWPSQSAAPGRPRAGVLLIVLQFGLASFAYGYSHMPYILYPDLTIQDAFTDPVMFRWLLYGYGGGLAILIPAFYIFWRLFMKDKRYLQAKPEEENQY